MELKDLDKADLLSLTQTESQDVIEEVVHSVMWVILSVLDVKEKIKMQSQQNRLMLPPKARASYLGPYLKILIDS